LRHGAFTRPSHGCTSPTPRCNDPPPTQAHQHHAPEKSSAPHLGSPAPHPGASVGLPGRPAAREHPRMTPPPARPEGRAAEAAAAGIGGTAPAADAAHRLKPEG